MHAQEWRHNRAGRMSHSGAPTCRLNQPTLPENERELRDPNGHPYRHGGDHCRSKEPLGLVHPTGKDPREMARVLVPGLGDSHDGVGRQVLHEVIRSHARRAAQRRSAEPSAASSTPSRRLSCDSESATTSTGPSSGVTDAAAALRGIVRNGTRPPRTRYARSISTSSRISLVGPASRRCQWA